MSKGVHGGGSMARKVASTGYWTFFCNPNFYDIDVRLKQDIPEDSWRVTEWQGEDFAPGQCGVVRVGKDHRPRRVLKGRNQLHSGVYAIVEVVGRVQPPDNRPEPLWIQEKPPAPWVPIRYLHNLVRCPLTFDRLAVDSDVAADPYLIRGFQASTMPLLPKAFKGILAMVDSPERQTAAPLSSPAAARDAAVLRKGTGTLLGVSIEGRYLELGVKQDVTTLEFGDSLKMDEAAWFALLNAEVDVVTKGGKVIHVSRTEGRA